MYNLMQEIHRDTKQTGNACQHSEISEWINIKKKKEGVTSNGQDLQDEQNSIWNGLDTWTNKTTTSVTRPGREQVLDNTSLDEFSFMLCVSKSWRGDRIGNLQLAW